MPLPRVRWIEALAFAAYVLVVITGVIVHEPWWDEAQAWLLARDASITELVTTRLRYEGHPLLWYLLLAPAAKLGAPFKAINVISALVGTLGAALLLTKSKAPLLVRIPLVLSFFVAYQYTVVSRSYVLLFPLLLALVITYEQRSERFVRFCVLLVLLSQVSLHGLAFAGAFFVLFLIDLARRREHVPLRPFLIGCTLLLLNLAAVLWMLWPPADPGHRVMESLAVLLGARNLIDVFVLGSGSTLAGSHTIPRMVLSGLMLVVLLVWLARRRALGAYLLMTLLVLPLCAMHFSAWHAGMFFLALMVPVLLAFQRQANGVDRRLEIAALCVVAILLVRQARFTFTSLGHDIAQEFTGTREAAAYIREHGLHRTKLYGVGMGVIGIQPYFSENVFRNYTTPGNAAFWHWSSANPWPYRPGTTPERARQWLETMLAERPDYFVCAADFLGDPVTVRVLARSPEYKAIALFEGQAVWEDRPAWRDTFVIYERVRVSP